MPASRKSKSVTIGNAWVGRFSLQKHAIAIQNSIKTARQKVLRTGANIHHEYNNDYLNSNNIANIYFTSDVDAKNKVRDLNEKIISKHV